jgi:hypothetical protein
MEARNLEGITVESNDLWYSTFRRFQWETGSQSSHAMPDFVKKEGSFGRA